MTQTAAEPRAMLVDPIDLAVIESSVNGIVREMQNSIYRTGYSTAIRESQDASCAILTSDGRVMGQFDAVAAHLGAYPAILRGLLDRYDLSEMEPGDTFIMNQPYMG